LKNGPYPDNNFNGYADMWNHEPAGRNPERRSLKLFLWCLAAEPLILAAVGYLIGKRIAASPKIDTSLNHIQLIAFAVVSLILIWIGFQFASGRFLAKTNRPATTKETLPPGHHIAALALFTAPGILGLVHYLLFGDLWVLGVLGSSLLAAHHILYRAES